MASGALAVLTGDVIRSARLGPDGLDRVMAALAAGAEAMSAWDGALPARFERFRGDGWQCLAPAPRFGLRAALFLRAQVRALGIDADTRVSVGIGPGVAPPGALSGAGGPAFEASGRGLDGLSRGPQIVVAWAEPPAEAGLIGAVFALCDEISRGWTAPQAEVLRETLAPGDAAQRALATERGVSQQAIAKRLSGGGDWAIRRALAAVEGAG